MFFGHAKHPARCLITGNGTLFCHNWRNLQTARLDKLDASIFVPFHGYRLHEKIYAFFCLVGLVYRCSLWAKGASAWASASSIARKLSGERVDVAFTRVALGQARFLLTSGRGAQYLDGALRIAIGTGGQAIVLAEHSA